MPTKAARRRSERRRKPRADARLSMRVEGSHDGEATQIVTESQNISASGVYCTSSRFLPPLSKIALTIVLPKVPGGRGTQELIKCDGIVVRCEPVAKKADKRWELACMFSGLEDRRRGQIEEFVTWRNLQSLRAAARAANGTPRKTKKKAAKKGTALAASPARKKAATRR